MRIEQAVAETRVKRKDNAHAGESEKDPIAEKVSTKEGNDC